MRNNMTRKQKLRFSKIIIIVVIILIALFSYKVLDIYEKIGSEPSVLIGAFFTIMCTELLALAKLKLEENDKTKNYTEDALPIENKKETTEEQDEV